MNNIGKSPRHERKQVYKTILKKKNGRSIYLLKNLSF